MKKLISLLAALAVVSTASVAFAEETSYGTVDATNATTLTANDDGSYTVSDSASDQGTILAVQGTSIKVGSIQYINQATASNGSASFNFKLNDSRIAKADGVATDDVYVLTSDGKVKVIDLTPEASTGYTISGTVIDENLSEIDLSDEDLGFEEEEIEVFKKAWGTTVYLVSDDDEHTNMVNYLLKYLGDEEAEFTSVASTTADFTSGAYSFSDVEAGKYVLIFERPSALPLFSYVTVSDSNVTVESKSLLLGDIEKDYSCDGSDILVLLNSSASYGEDLYNADYDFYPDWSIDGSDVLVVLTNSNLSYEESAVDDALAALE